MERTTEEKQLLASGRDYWATFQLRFANYYAWEKNITAKAIIDCSNLLVRRLGHTADHYVFGNDDFTPSDLTALFSSLRILSEHTRRQNFHQGETAIAALRAVASLQFLKIVGSTSAVRKLAESKLGPIQDELRQIVLHAPIIIAEDLDPLDV